MTVKPILLFGYGNPSRGDDALGPLLAERIENQAGLFWPVVEVLCDFQLQIEHALDLEGRELVLFVDAAASGVAGFGFEQLTPIRDTSYSSHAMSPSALLSVYRDIKKLPPPPAFLLSIKGEQFALGEELSLAAQEHLAGACRFAGGLLDCPDYRHWRSFRTRRGWPLST